MEIRYIPTVEDVLAFERYQLKHGPVEARIGRWVYTGGCLFILGVVLLAGYLNEGFLLAFSMWFVGVGGIAFVVAYFIGRNLMIRRLKRSLQPLAEDPINNPMFAEHCITLSAAGIHIARPRNNSTMTWAAVCKIVPTEEHAFFYDSPMSFIAIVPRRCFRDEAEYKAFVADAQAFLASRGSTASGQASEGRTGQIDGTLSLDSSERMPDRDLMNVTGELTEPDIFALVRYEQYLARLRRRPNAPAQRWLWVASGCILCSIFLFQWLFGSSEEKAEIGRLFLFVAVMTLFFRLALRWWNHRSFKRARAEGFLTSAITIAPSYCRIAENNSFSDLDWRLVERIDIIKDSLFLALAASSVIIPFRFFQTDDQRVRFIELAREYHHAAASSHP